MVCEGITLFAVKFLVAGSGDRTTAVLGGVFGVVQEVGCFVFFMMRNHKKFVREANPERKATLMRALHVKMVNCVGDMILEYYCSFASIYSVYFFRGHAEFRVLNEAGAEYERRAPYQ